MAPCVSDDGQLHHGVLSPWPLPKPTRSGFLCVSRRLAPVLIPKRALCPAWPRAQSAITPATFDKPPCQSTLCGVASMSCAALTREALQTAFQLMHYNNLLFHMRGVSFYRMICVQRMVGRHSQEVVAFDGTHWQKAVYYAIVAILTADISMWCLYQSMTVRLCVYACFTWRKGSVSHWCAESLIPSSCCCSSSAPSSRGSWIRSGCILH